MRRSFVPGYRPRNFPRLPGGFGAGGGGHPIVPTAIGASIVSSDILSAGLIGQGALAAAISSSDVLSAGLIGQGALAAAITSTDTLSGTLLAPYPQVSSLLAWCVTDDAVNNGSGGCASLTDRKNGHVFSGAAPFYSLNTSAIAGHTVLDNTGAVAQLTNTDAACLSAFSARNEWTAFTYVKQTSVDTNPHYFLSCDDGSSTNRSAAGLGKSGTYGGELDRHNAGSGSAVNEPGSNPGTAWHTHAIGFSYASSGNVAKLNYWYDGAFVGSVNASSVSITLANLIILNLGPTQDGLTPAVIGQFGVWGIVSALSSNADVLAMHQWCTAYF